MYTRYALMKIFQKFCKERGMNESIDSMLMMMWIRGWLNTTQIRKDLEN